MNEHENTDAGKTTARTKERMTRVQEFSISPIVLDLLLGVSSSMGSSMTVMQIFGESIACKKFKMNTTLTCIGKITQICNQEGTLDA